jgi:hypothetical protein
MAGRLSRILIFRNDLPTELFPSPQIKSKGPRV